MGSNLEIGKGNYNGNIKNNLKNATDIFMWKIKFPASINTSKYDERDFNIVDCNNNIFDCSVNKNDEENSIAIVPNQKYAKDKYYYLNINYHSNNKKMYVAFRLLNDKFETKIFKSQNEYEEFIFNDRNNFMEVRVNINNKSTTRKKNNTYRDYVFEFLKFKYNIVPIIIFMIISILLIFGAITNFVLLEFIIAEIEMAIFWGTIQLIVYLLQRKLHKSIIAYNKGVNAFNDKCYSAALKHFKESVYLNRKNKSAVEAVKIVNICLNESN